MGLFSGLMGGDTATQTTTTAPSPYIRPSFHNYARLLKDFTGGPLSSAFDVYQGPTLAAQSPLTAGGISALANPQYYQQALNYFGDVAGGNYLGLNPAMQQAVMDPAIEAVNARFNQFGRFGGGLNQESAAEAAMRSLMPYYSQERQRQGQAAGLLPQLGQQAAAAQLQAGGLQEQYGQRDIQEAMNQFQQQAYDPRLAALQAMGPLTQVGSQWGITEGQVQQPQGSPLAGALGGAMLGGSVLDSDLVNGFGPLAFLGGMGGAPFVGSMAALGGLLA